MMKNFFFILSFSRSGSTTLGQKLNNHSDIDVINESWIFNLLGVLKWKKLSPLRQKYILNQLNKGQKSITSIQSNEITDDTISVEHFFQAIFTTASNFIGEKTPTNLFYYSYIKAQFKSAKFLFLKRHPLAICSSYFSRWYSSTYDDKFIVETVDVIKAYSNMFESIEVKDEILQLKYEDLVSDSKVWLTAIAEHIGSEFEVSMLTESEVKLFENSVDEKHHHDSHKSLNTSHIDKYKSAFTPQQLQELSYLLRKEINTLGYSVEEITPNPRLLRLEKRIGLKRSPGTLFYRTKLKLIKTKLSFLKFILEQRFR
tara:strand:- start:1489 stop:2430 length:942 start_codon:yes stop_codon:yes gene_type:complete